MSYLQHDDKCNVGDGSRSSRCMLAIDIGDISYKYCVYNIAAQVALRGDLLWINLPSPPPSKENVDAHSFRLCRAVDVTNC